MGRGVYQTPKNLKEKEIKIMIFWLCLALLIIGIGLIVIGCIDWDYEKNKLFDFLYDNDDTLRSIGCITTFISGLTMIIMITILCCMYIGIDARVEHLMQLHIRWKAVLVAMSLDFLIKK